MRAFQAWRRGQRIRLRRLQVLAALALALTGVGAIVLLWPGEGSDDQPAPQAAGLTPELAEYAREIEAAYNAICTTPHAERMWFLANDLCNAGYTWEDGRSPQLRVADFVRTISGLFEHLVQPGPGPAERRWYLVAHDLITKGTPWGRFTLRCNDCPLDAAFFNSARDEWEEFAFRRFGAEVSWAGRELFECAKRIQQLAEEGETLPADSIVPHHLAHGAEIRVRNHVPPQFDGSAVIVLDSQAGEYKLALAAWAYEPSLTGRDVLVSLEFTWLGGDHD